MSEITLSKLLPDPVPPPAPVPPDPEPVTPRPVEKSNALPLIIGALAVVAFIFYHFTA